MHVADPSRWDLEEGAPGGTFFKLSVDISVNYTIANFLANQTVLVFKYYEPDVPSSFSFDQRYTTFLSADLFQFKID